MADLLLHGLYARILDLQALFLLAVAWWRVRELRAASPPGELAPPWTPERLFVALLGAVAVAGLAIFTRASLPASPQVYFDEFWYLATARHLVSSGDASPMLFQGLDGVALPGSEFRPPYPQGWPWLLAWALRLAPAPDTAFSLGVGVERVVGILAPLAAYGMLCGESLLAAGYAGAALAVLPASVRLGMGASSEGASLLFVVLFLWAARSYRRLPGRAGACLVVAAGGWACHFRPENLLYLLLFLPLAFSPRTSPVKPGCGGDRPRQARLVLCLLLVLMIGPDLTIMVAGARGARSADHFVAHPRPGFASVAENALANLRENAAFLVDGRVLPPWVTPLALLGTVLLWRRGEHRIVLLHWGWVALFTLALSPFPFGDFAAAFSLDTWRFSLHVSLPLILLGAWGVEEARRLLPASVRPALPVLVALVLLPWSLGPDFVRRPHRLEPTWQALGEVRVLLPREALVIVDDPSLAVTLREGLAMDAVLGPVDPAEAQRRSHERPLYLLDASGSPPEQWARFPLRVEWAAPPPPSSDPSPGMAPARVVVYAWQN